MTRFELLLLFFASILSRGSSALDGEDRCLLCIVHLAIVESHEDGWEDSDAVIEAAKVAHQRHKRVGGPLKHVLFVRQLQLQTVDVVPPSGLPNGLIFFFAALVCQKVLVFWFETDQSKIVAAIDVFSRTQVEYNALVIAHLQALKNAFKFASF